MARKINLMIVPDNGGQAKSLTLNTVWLKFLMWVGIFIVLAIIAGAISYSGVASRALDYNRLSSEKAQLEVENRRIIRVAREVEQSRKILAQIIRSLGGHLELGRQIDADSLIDYTGSMDPTDMSHDAMSLLGSESYAVERLMAHSMPTQMPVDGFISQSFNQDYLFPKRSHLGIDVAGKSGTPVVAAAAGRVIFSGWTPYFGNCLILAHQGGYMTFYGHNRVNLKHIQEEVARGEPLALLGNSGYSSAPHLHFEIWKDGVPVDPQEFVRGEVN